MHLSAERFIDVLESLGMSGRLASTRGKTAQWIAQATEVVIPNASQFVLYLIQKNDSQMIRKNTIKRNGVANYYVIFFLRGYVRSTIITLYPALRLNGREA